MIKEYFDRYKQFKRGDNTISPNIPIVSIPETSLWKTEKYILGESRLDILADKFYGDPNLGFLIMLVNKDKFNGGLEFSPINDEIILKIPFPKKESLTALSKAYKDYERYYGL